MNNTFSNKIILRITAALDVFLYIFPSAWGGDKLRHFFYRTRFNRLGKNVKISERVVIKGFSNIEIGNSTSIMSGSYLYAHDGGMLMIGENCSFNHNVMIGAARGEIKIGNDVLIGPNTVLRAASHVYSDIKTPIRKQGHKSQKIIVSNDVWIASNVVVTGDVVVSEGVVIGAGSVVTRDLPEYFLCVGVPCHPVKDRRSSESIRE
jgi:galactoside O-acetyltransferase